MRFTLEQRFVNPVEEVQAAFVHPALLMELATLQELGRPQLLELVDDGASVSRQVRYTFTGDLPPAVTAVLDPRRLTWVEHSELDRATHRSVFRIQPDHYPDRLSCSGMISLEPVGGATRRTIDGDLRVRFPLVGPKVERAIVSGLHDHASTEARVVQAWLARR